MTALVKENVFRLDISMDNPLLVQTLDGQDLAAWL
jgi:hypothetical protein